MIRTHGLTKTFGSAHAVDDLTLRVDEGDVFGFIGPNGAGKTTTIRMLATLLRPTAGAAAVAGLDVQTQPREVKRVVGYMPDYFGVYDGMRVREHLDFFGAAFGIPAKTRRRVIDDLLALTDLTDKADEFASALSRGVRQRLCLATTLVHDPQVLLLDEPASGLDPRARVEFRALLNELRRMGKTIFISSHILTELADVCNKIAIVEQGRLVAAGAVDEILRTARPSRVLEIEVVDGADAVERVLASHPGLGRVARVGNEFQVEAQLALDELCALHEAVMAADAKVLWFRERRVDLEEAFMRLTKGIVS